MKNLTPNQVEALASAHNGSGYIAQIPGGPSVTTIRVLFREKLVRMSERPTNVGYGGRIWSARLTNLGWQYWTVFLAKKSGIQLELEQVVIIDGEPTIDGMTPEEWLEAITGTED